MERSEGKSDQNPRKKQPKISHKAQIFLRISALLSSAISACLMLTAHEEALIYGLSMSAKFSYSPAFKFAAYVNVVASAFSLLSLGVAFVIIRRGNPINYYFVFLHDLVIMSLVLGGSAAATAIGYVGKYGNSHAGWLPICDHFTSFCNKVSASVILSYISVTFFLLLAVISAANSTYDRNVDEQI
ncbi:hypothetical protein Nepgr_033357 [Nepenthes gracilis]|uniref:CASP-like protein n=1 Tax=Nepenthes gracilis TaxID=150966 RepID=A0AAD3Y8L5_NEPGR|nr:hypothetical protein Nepgr_033357 [Nepenthes gracilis]